MIQSAMAEASCIFGSILGSPVYSEGSEAHSLARFELLEHPWGSRSAESGGGLHRVVAQRTRTSSGLKDAHVVAGG
eukprot:CAMPEP_0179175998 /NCGR_PEP_ID=MMETSP0796-20121207/86977_1 /TAXON_ID=73915 /ORGANISM="Pyrodinium bahamense, Strain pbaha01" /LENGTH=75 /DNA_ID=CAMNT_0020879443 /DNA_START=11 /DNA_END=235 /DNA_ORIENTATION=-